MKKCLVACPVPSCIFHVHSQQSWSRNMILVLYMPRRCFTCSATPEHLAYLWICPFPISCKLVASTDSMWRFLWERQEMFELPSSDGRLLKPSLVHGDCWDGNTAMDMKTGEAFIFDVCSFYGHNEYDTGNWRAPRHRLSNKAYIKNYKLHYPMSEPGAPHSIRLPRQAVCQMQYPIVVLTFATEVEDWDARNLLYSLPYNVGNAIYVLGSSQRQV